MIRKKRNRKRGMLRAVSIAVIAAMTAAAGMGAVREITDPIIVSAAEAQTETGNSPEAASEKIEAAGNTDAENQEKIVRVGYVNALNYEEGGEGEYKRGAGYEYLQKISYLTGWKYEYVYGSFKECSEMLAAGEIDLFGNVSYTPERAELFDYSAYPQGKDTYWLYTAKNRSDLASGDMKKLNGCRIGVTGGSYQEGLLKNWLEENKIQAEVVECSGYDEMMSGMNAGELDVIAAPDLSTSYDYLALVSIGSSDFYFAVSKEKPEILEELNAALYEIQNAEADYNTKLVSRYYYKAASGLSFNEEEQTWLAEHDQTIRLGYLKDNLPFSGEEDGELNGVLSTVVSALESEYGITIEAKAYDGLTEMKEALRNQEIDAAGPVIRDLYLAEQDDFVLTDSIVDTTPVIIYKGDDYNDSVNVIATSDASLFNPEIVKVLFPDAKIYLCDNQKECLKAVADGKAGSMLIASSRINILNADPLMENLSYAEMAKQTDIGLLSTKENRRAASIINKGIEQSSDVLSGVVLSQHSVAEENISILEFVSSHAWLIIGLAGVIILVLGVLLYRLSAGRKQLVAALADARDANAANVAKTTFLNNMSHDIRTPMNAIIGFTNIAMKRRPSPEIKSCLEKIQQSSDYLLTLMNDVLDVSRIESGKIEYNPVPVELDEVADTVINITNGFMENRDLKLRVKRTGMEKPCAMADELRLREVLLNIISNAVKFTDDGGSITVEMDYYPSGDGTHVLVTYRIIDTGIGIGKEFIGKIFDEFAQEEGGARTKYKGTGLGMSITKRYVELMGGTIAVESKKNVGTTVTVKLPLELVQREEPELPEETAEEQSLDGVRVLMAEDNDLNAEIAALLLEEQNMKVTRAVDGQDAVEQFRAAPAGTFDLVLMDIMMPRMNGYEATQAIRSMEDRPDGKTIPIIAMTANAFAEDVQAAADAGMNAHLSKPVNPDVFYKALREHVHGQS